MKDNEGFIKDVYKKYDEYKRDKFKTKKQKRKLNNIRKIINMAAIFIIVFTLGVIINGANNLEENKDKKVATDKIEENKITLATIDNFENFYNIVKEQYNSNNETKYNETLEKNGPKAESSVTDSTVNNLQSFSATKRENNHSNTNTQVENVDEADIVKIDGNYIYYLLKKKLVIVDIKDTLKIIATIDYSEGKFNASEIYVNDKKLIVLGNSIEYNRDGMKTVCETVDTDYVIGGSSNKAIAIIYDLSKIEEPKEERRIEIDGNYISSRMIGDNIYFISNKYFYSNSILKDKIENLNENDYKPKYIDTAISNEEKYIEFNEIYKFEEIEDIKYLNITGFNIKNNNKANIETFLGAGDIVYCSEKNMYITKAKSLFDIGTGEDLGYNTRILKFALNGEKIEYKAETNINGKINNQFSIDEDAEGNLRLAATIGKLWDMDENTSNSIYILNDKLEEVGKLERIAKTEKIYSVRYVGNLAYVVTFKQTDPLFVIDLSDKTAPKILGELKLPGYSTYLHPYDETHIIGFGYETKENGTAVTTDGLKMVMFDVSDLSNPKVLFKVNIGDKRTYSNLIDNHKALLYSKEKNMIAFPTYKYTQNGITSSALIYGIDLEKGFTLKGEISQKGDYQEKIERIVYSGDKIYCLSEKSIKACDINTLKQLEEKSIK